MNKKLKAFMVTDGFGSVLVHEKSRNAARYTGKNIIANYFSSFTDEISYCDLSAYRLKTLDEQYFTYENLCQEFGKDRVDEWGYYPGKLYFPDCQCEDCRVAYGKPVCELNNGGGDV